MGVSFAVAEKHLEDAARELFKGDPRVQAVGVGAHGDEYGFHMIRNTNMILPLSAAIRPAPTAVHNIPLTILDRQESVQPHLRLPFSGPGSPGTASLVPEQQRHRPLCCGLQIQNYDDDVRTHVIAGGSIIIGTLGCFVKTSAGEIAILSNNHVIAGENRGQKNSDRITQPGTGSIGSGDQVATLTDFIAINSSPAGATPAAGNVNFNVVDAGIAKLSQGVSYHQRFLASRSLPPPAGVAIPAVHDRVFKVGRTTGLTRGKITSVTNVVGPVPYSGLSCWFRRSLTIEGDNGTMFSDHGDSGSAILKEGTGEVLGILYAGNGVDTFACPIQDVLQLLNCQIV